MNAGETIFTVHHQAHTLPPGTGFGVFCLYATAALATAFALINHRDASRRSVPSRRHRRAPAGKRIEGKQC